MKHNNNIFRFCLSLLCLIVGSLFFITAPLSAEIIILEDRNETYELGKKVRYYEDKTNQLTRSDIQKKSYFSQFKQSEESIPFFGFTSSTYWVHFQIKDISTICNNWILEMGYSFYENIDIFILKDGKKIRHIHSGDHIHPNKRDVKHRNYLFKLLLSKNEIYDVFIKVQNRQIMVFPLTVRSISSMSQKIQTEYIFLGIFYGFIIIMIFYNFFIFISIKGASYLYYIGYIFSYMWWQLSYNGLGYVYIWSGFPEFTGLSRLYFSSLTLLFLLLFSRKFLFIKDNSKILDRLFLVLISCAGLLFLLTLLGLYSITILKLFNIYNAIVTIVIFAGAILTLIKGFRPAIYFLMAWFLFSCGMVVFNVMTLNLIPYSFITANGIQIGAAALVFLFAIALMDRINIIKKEKELAQKEALRIQQNVQAELKTMVEERTISLNEQTEKFKKANRFINSIIDNSPYAIHVLDGNGVITLHNQAMKDIIGDYSGETLGKNIFDFESHQAPVLRKIFEDALQGLSFYGTNIKFKSSVSNKMLFINLAVSPVINTDTGIVENVITMFYDNTDKALSDMELKRIMNVISEDLAMAKKIQQKTLSFDLNSILNLKLTIHFEPMFDVGGDIYDIFKLDYNHYRIFLADATGHGVQAALLTMIIKGEYDSVKNYGLPVNETLEMLNDEFYKNYYNLHTFFTCVLVDIDTNQGTFEMASAGHNRQFLLTDTGLKDLKCKGKLIGFINNCVYEKKKYRYRSGDKLLLFSDGLEEAHNEDNVLFGEDIFEKVLRENIPNDIDSTVNNLIHELRFWRGVKDPNDDITVIGIEFV